MRLKARSKAADRNREPRQRQSANIVDAQAIGGACLIADEANSPRGIGSRQLFDGGDCVIDTGRVRRLNNPRGIYESKPGAVDPENCLHTARVSIQKPEPTNPIRLINTRSMTGYAVHETAR
jgi:hypothetical protein